VLFPSFHSAKTRRIEATETSCCWSERIRPATEESLKAVNGTTRCEAALVPKTGCVVGVNPSRRAE
jgi:hypothetical protein